MPLHLSNYPISEKTGLDLRIARGGRYGATYIGHVERTVQQIIKAENESSPFYNIDISSINIPLSRNFDRFVKNLGEFLFEITQTGFGHIYYAMGSNGEIAFQKLQELHSSEFPFGEIQKLSKLGEEEHFPYPPRLNSTVRPEVRAMLTRITKRPLKQYIGKSLTELRGEAPCGEVFWQFGIACARNGIQLRP